MLTLSLFLLFIFFKFALGSMLGFLFIFCSGVLYSVAPSVSQAYGAEDSGAMVLAARQAVWLALLLALPVTVLLQFTEPLLLFTGQDPEVAALARSAIEALARFDAGFAPATRPFGVERTVLALFVTPLQSLAGPDGDAGLRDRFRQRTA